MNSTPGENSQNIDSNSHFLVIIQAVLQFITIEFATTVTDTIAAIHIIQFIATKCVVFSKFLHLLNFISVWIHG